MSREAPAAGKIPSVNATAESAVLSRRARSPATPKVRAVATAAALTGMVVSATIIAVNAASLGTPLVAGGKRLPGSIAGPFSGLGDHLSVAEFTVLFTIMCGCYAVVIALRGGGLDKRVLIGAIVLLH